MKNSDEAANSVARSAAPGHRNDGTQPTVAEELGQRLRATVPVVALFARSGEERNCSQGSALVVGPRQLLTANHVVKGKDTFRIRVPNASIPGQFDLLGATLEAVDSEHDLALLTTKTDLTLPPAQLVGDLFIEDLKSLDQFHAEDLVVWRGFGFPNQTEKAASNSSWGNIWEDASVTYEGNREFGQPTPYQVSSLVPTELSREDWSIATGIKLPFLDIPKGESGGALLVFNDGQWFSLGHLRLGGDGAASTNVRLYRNQQNPLQSLCELVPVQRFLSKDGFLQALGLDLDSVLERRSKRCRDDWERTWTSLDFVDNPDDESRWLAFYVPPDFSRIVRANRAEEVGVRETGSVAASAPLDSPRLLSEEQRNETRHQLELNAFSSGTSPSSRQPDGWKAVPGSHEEERLAHLLSPRLLIVFEGPGAGKTIFTKRIEAFFSSETGRRLSDVNDGRPLLVVRQASWEQHRWSPEFEDSLVSDAKQSRSFAKRLAAAAMDDGRVVWILDGLDQLPENNRDTILEGIRGFLLSDRGKKVRVVVTSRPGAVRDQLDKFLKGDQQVSLGLNWQYARIEPFSIEQQYRYLYGPEPPDSADKSGQTRGGYRSDAWSGRSLDWQRINTHRIVPRAKTLREDEFVKSIATLVENYGEERIQQLLSNPAVLAVIRTLHQEGRLPTFRRRAELYDELSHRMIRRALEKLAVQVKPERVEAILAALAFASMTVDASTHEFRGRAVSTIHEKADERMRVAATGQEWSIINEMPNQTSRSFLLTSDRGELRWSHKGVMEFYCGKFLANNTDPNWVPLSGYSDAPVCGDRAVWPCAAKSEWSEAFRFAIELGLSLPPNERNERVLLASLGMLYERPEPEREQERPTQLMFEAWSLLEKLPPCDWYDSIQPVPLARGWAVIERFRRQFGEIAENPSQPGYKIATTILSNFVRCPPTNDSGEDDLKFWLGSPEDEPGRREDEPIQHRWSITEAFEMGRYPVTNAEYELFDSHHARSFLKELSKADLDRHPVVEVSWYSAWMFAAWLGPECRLPAEREWEFACRAGTETPFHFGDRCDGRQANCAGTADPEYGGAGAAGVFFRHTSSVGAYPPNQFGLHDAHGNVLEWCETSYAGAFKQGDTSTYRGSARVLRGGSWNGGPAHCRSASRNGGAPADRNNDVGFRVARAPSRKP